MKGLRGTEAYANRLVSLLALINFVHCQAEGDDDMTQKVKLLYVVGLACDASIPAQTTVNDEWLLPSHECGWSSSSGSEGNGTPPT
eukprot:5575311-Amphidinium_carterae.1